MAISLNAQGEHVDDLADVLDELRAVFAKGGWLSAEAFVTDGEQSERLNLMPEPVEPEPVEPPPPPPPPPWAHAPN